MKLKPYSKPAPIRKRASESNELADLIEGFETPYGMELLATVHWTAAENPKATFDEIVQAVQGWNVRKRQIMPPAHIKSAYDRLVAERWI